LRKIESKPPDILASRFGNINLTTAVDVDTERMMKVAVFPAFLAEYPAHFTIERKREQAMIAGISNQKRRSANPGDADRQVKVIHRNVFSRPGVALSVLIGAPDEVIRVSAGKKILFAVGIV